MNSYESAGMDGTYRQYSPSVSMWVRTLDTCDSRAGYLVFEEGLFYLTDNFWDWTLGQHQWDNDTDHLFIGCNCDRMAHVPKGTAVSCCVHADILKFVLDSKSLKFCQNVQNFRNYRSSNGRSGECGV